MEDDGFIKVTYRAAKRRKKKQILKTNQKDTDCSELVFASAQNTSSAIVNNINKYKAQMLSSEYFNQFCDLFKIAMKTVEVSPEKAKHDDDHLVERHDDEHLLEDVNMQDIVCYGLGSFSTSVNTFPQMALLLLIRDIIKCSNLFLYDPEFTKIDSDVFNQLNCFVINANEEGKRKIQRNTIFYLPHCGRPLYNSILWANWTPENLSKIILIGNSFIKFAANPYPGTSSPQRKHSYIFRVLPAVVEYDIPNTFPSENVFNNFTIITFNSAVLQMFNEDMWKNVEEPFYSSDDEIILK